MRNEVGNFQSALLGQIQPALTGVSGDGPATAGPGMVTATMPHCVLPSARHRRMLPATRPETGRAMFNLRSLDLNLLTVFEAIYELGNVTDEIAAFLWAIAHEVEPAAVATGISSTRC
jgi:hypothetical protein